MNPYNQQKNSRQSKQTSPGSPQGDLRAEESNPGTTPDGNSKDWMKNPKLAGMDPAKLEMLQNLANQGSQKSQQELLPFLMSLSNPGNQNGLSFQPNEANAIIEVLKMGKSPQEQAKLDKIIQLMKMMKR